MKVKQIYIYPIKSLRGITIPTATVTRFGFKYDRRFMLLKVDTNAPSTNANANAPAYKNMLVSRFPEMALFETEILGLDFSSSVTATSESDNTRIKVTFHPPTDADSASASDATAKGVKRTIDIPLTPSTRGLEEIPIELHKSPTTGFNMGDEVNSWFSAWFGYEVVLVYLGDENSRPVLGSYEPRKHAAHRDRVGQASENTVLGALAAVLVVGLGVGGTIAGTDLWVRGLGVGVTGALGILAYFVFGWVAVATAGGGREERLTFSDTSPYMVVSETSVADVSGRLEGQEMDVRKFRMNVVVEGAESAFEEDFWAELAIGREKVRILLTANCIRCSSLNVDYSTGKMGTGEAGSVLKKLMGDRRVDSGAKYSPVFGRYGFLEGGSEAKTVSVGDEVIVARRMNERSVHDWPSLS